MAYTTTIRKRFNDAKDKGGGIQPKANENARKKASEEISGAIKRKVGGVIGGVASAVKRAVKPEPDLSGIKAQIKEKQAQVKGARILKRMGKK